MWSGDAEDNPFRSMTQARMIAGEAAKAEITEQDPFNRISNFAWNTDLR